MSVPKPLAIASESGLLSNVNDPNEGPNFRPQVENPLLILSRDRWTYLALRACRPHRFPATSWRRYQSWPAGRYQALHQALCLSLWIAAGLGARPLGAAEYRIGAYDELAVAVGENPDLSRSAIVRPDGYISLPLAEDMRAAGLTPSELAAAITERLATYLINAEVSVDVVRSAGAAGASGSVSASFERNVQLLGGSQPVRAIPFQAGMQLIDVIAAVGGLSPGADRSRAVLVREGPDGPQRLPLRLDDLVDRGDASANVAVEPGDLIIVPDGFFPGTGSASFRPPSGAYLRTIIS